MPDCSLCMLLPYDQKTLVSGLWTAGLTDRRKAPTKDQNGKISSVGISMLMVLSGTAGN